MYLQLETLLGDAASSDLAFLVLGVSLVSLVDFTYLSIMLISSLISIQSFLECRLFILYLSNMLI